MSTFLHDPASRTLLARIFLGLLGGSLSSLLLFRPLPEWLRQLPRGRFDGGLLGAYTLARVFLMVSLFVIGHQQLHSDLPAFYLPQARWVLEGKLPYRDFYSSYAPLFSIINAGLLHIWNSGLTLLIFSVVCDIAALPIWLRVLRRFLSEDAVRCAGVLMLLQPVVLWNRSVSGGNEAEISLLLALSVYFVARRDLISGGWSTSSLILVKFLPALFLPQIFFAAKQRGRWLIGAAVLPVLVFGWLVLHGFNVLLPLQHEGHLSTSGNLSYSLISLTGISVTDRVLDVLTAAALAGVLLWMGRAALRAASDSARMWVLSLGMLAIQLALLIVSKKSYPIYLTPLAFPMAGYLSVSAYERRERSMAVIYAVLMVVSMFVTSLWYGPMRMGPLELHAGMMQGSGRAWMEWVLMTLPVPCYAWLLYGMLRDANRPADFAS